MPFSRDTSPEARRAQFEQLRRMTPQERLALAFEMSEKMHAEVREGVQRDLPEATTDEKQEEFFRRWVGEPLATEVIAWRRQRISEGVACPTLFEGPRGVDQTSDEGH